MTHRGRLKCGSVLTANDIRQRCVDDLTKAPYDGAVEVLAKVIIKAVRELTAIEGISKAVRFEREMFHAIKMSEGADQGGNARSGKSNNWKASQFRRKGKS